MNEDLRTFATAMIAITAAYLRPVINESEGKATNGTHLEKPRDGASPIGLVFVMPEYVFSDAPYCIQTYATPAAMAVASGVLLHDAGRVHKLAVYFRRDEIDLSFWLCSTTGPFKDYEGWKCLALYNLANFGLSDWRHCQ